PKGVREPSNNATPRVIIVIPRYIGFRVMRNTPCVTSVCEFSKGLTVVWCFLNAWFALRFNAIPITMGIRPSKHQGNVRKYLMGSKKCRKIIKTIVPKK
ncbi:MAG: hypothetical protein SVW57_12015, partial [Thermodesulfobacteriota bacterium]|nr:hypothetical protein [Thermodesulfobacteriota bacterium]